MLRRGGRGGQPRDVPGPVDGGLEREHVVDVELVPAAERGLADRLPVRAAGERLAAAAALVVAQPALPQVHRLADRADPGNLVEHPFHAAWSRTGRTRRGTRSAAAPAPAACAAPAGSSPSTSGRAAGRWPRSRPAARPPDRARSAAAASSAARRAASSSATVTSPLAPSRRENSCWWSSTCSSRAGSRGTTIGRCPALRASEIVAGPPWLTTTSALAISDCSLSQSRIRLAGGDLGRPGACRAARARPRRGRRPSGRPSRPAGRTGGSRSRRGPARASAAAHRSGPTTYRCPGRIPLLLPLHQEQPGERAAQPAGERRRVDPVVHLEVDGRDARAASRARRTAPRRRRRCDTITDGFAERSNRNARPVFRTRFGRLRVVGIVRPGDPLAGQLRRGVRCGERHPGPVAGRPTRPAGPAAGPGARRWTRPAASDPLPAGTRAILAAAPAAVIVSTLCTASGPVPPASSRPRCATSAGNLP